MTPTATLHNGDALAVLPTLPDNSVDLIATDPPYFRVKGEWWDRQWDTAAGFIDWIGKLCEQWQRVLKPNGSLYVFASPKMAARVECKVGETFNVLNRLVWRKPPFSTKAEMFRKGDLRTFFPASESIVFAEQRTPWFEPLRHYLDCELRGSGKSIAEVRDQLGFTGNMPFHWFARGMAKGMDSQWQLPTAEHYAALQRAVPGYFTRSYSDIYEEHEDLRRPFGVTADVPYTDVWASPPSTPIPASTRARSRWR